MKDFFHKYYILLIITILAVVALCSLSYLTVLDYAFTNEEMYILTCNDSAVEEIETSLLYGKSLSNYYALDQVLIRSREVIAKDGSECILLIVDPEGNVLATSNEEEHFTISLSDYGSISQDIHDGEGNVAGVLTTYYPKDAVTKSIKGTTNYAVIGSIVIVVLLILVLLIAGNLRKLRNETVMLMVVVAVIIQGVFLTAVYVKEFEKVTQKSISAVAAYLSSSIESVLDKGISLDEIADLEEYLDTKKQENTFIKNIYFDNTENVPNDSDYFVTKLTGTDSNLVLVYHISEGYVRKNIINMMLMFAATIILAVIILKESLSLSEMISFRKNAEFQKPTDMQYANIASAIRYGNFLSLTAEYMCVSFSALQIKEWNQGVWGLTPVMAAALSISICSIADMVGMVAMPAISRKIDTKILMLISGTVIFISNLFCFFTTSTLVIIVMRFFAGMGSAGTKQVRNEVITKGCATDQHRNSNLEASNMGVIGGLLCGLGLGGVVAGVFGYGATFLAAAIGYGMYLVFEFTCIPWKLISSKDAAGDDSADLSTGFAKRFFKVAVSPSVWKSIFTMVVPQYFLLMIIVCLIPGRIQSLGLPGVVLTYANLLNGIAGLYLGEFVYKILRKRIKNAEKIQALVYIGGALVFFLMDIPLAYSAIMLFTAILSGLLDGVGTPVSTDLFLGTKKIREGLEGSESLMLYSMIGSGVMSLAPFILEMCEKNIIWMLAVGGILAGLALVLFLGSRSGERNA